MNAKNEDEDLRQFALELYKAVNGREYPVFMNVDEFGGGVPADFVERAIYYWVEKGFMRRMGVGTNEVALTAEGIVEIQSWLSKD